MYKLEHGSEDKNLADNSKPRLAQLFNRNEDVWADSYTANQKLRAEFRVSRLHFKILFIYLLKDKKIIIPTSLLLHVLVSKIVVNQYNRLFFLTEKK